VPNLETLIIKHFPARKWISGRTDSDSPFTRTHFTAPYRAQWMLTAPQFHAGLAVTPMNPNPVQMP